MLVYCLAFFIALLCMRLVCCPVGDDMCTIPYTYDVVIVLYLLYQTGTTPHSLHKSSDTGVISSDRASIDNVSTPERVFTTLQISSIHSSDANDASSNDAE